MVFFYVMVYQLIYTWVLHAQISHAWRNRLILSWDKVIKHVEICLSDTTIIELKLDSRSLPMLLHAALFESVCYMIFGQKVFLLVHFKFLTHLLNFHHLIPQTFSRFVSLLNLKTDKIWVSWVLFDFWIWYYFGSSRHLVDRLKLLCSVRFFNIIVQSCWPLGTLSLVIIIL